MRLLPKGGGLLFSKVKSEPAVMRERVPDKLKALDERFFDIAPEPDDASDANYIVVELP